MLNRILILIFPLLSLTIATCDSRVIDNTASKETKMNIYNATWTTLNGDSFDANTLQGQVTLLVNVASECGYTKQYRELQELSNASRLP